MVCPRCEKPLEMIKGWREYGDQLVEVQHLGCWCGYQEPWPDEDEDEDDDWGSDAYEYESDYGALEDEYGPILLYFDFLGDD